MRVAVSEEASARAEGRVHPLLRPLFRLSPEEASFERRGFTAADPEARRRLEAVGRTFLAGYNAALAEDDPARLAGRLDRVPALQRGFAYEGAAMALALQDELSSLPASALARTGLIKRPPGGGEAGRLGRFLEGPGGPHAYMLHVGAGWALARLERGVGRHLAGSDPLHGWLAVDGYGFHEGYFHPGRHFPDPGQDGGLRERAGEVQAPAGLTEPARRVFDQGLGRSLWFVRGTDPGAIESTIARLDAARRGDLWSGVGLACAYAGGGREGTLRGLRTRAGERFGGHLAQGAAFAAEARERAGIPAPHTDRCCRLWCGTSAREAARRVREVRDELRHEADAGSASSRPPLYQRWRRRTRVVLVGEPGRLQGAR